MKGMFRVAAAAIAVLVASTAIAENRTFEFSAGYDRTQYDSFSQVLGSPGSAEFLSGSDTDALNLVGTWYFAGLSDDKGPRSRAALVDRSSELNLFYRRADVSSTISITSTIPTIEPGEAEISRTNTEFGASGRLTNRQNGWFVQAGLLNRDADTNDSAWNIGVGRYIFDATALALDYGEFDIGFRDYDTVGLGLEHVASLAGSWQYGVDFSYERVEGDFDDFNDWRLALALYPTRDIEFGVSYADQLIQLERSVLLAAQAESVEGFVSWFVSPDVELGARYRVDDFGGVGNQDQNSLGLSLNIRF